MAIDGNNKVASNVNSLSVRVLGGEFQVSEVLYDPAQTDRDVLALFEQTPADRWFVMVSESPGDGQDALALIDDDLEFQICAHGVLRGE